MSSPEAKKRPAHPWRFFRAGDVDQVRLDTGADLVHLDELDQKLWVALSCPVKGLELDEQTLDLLDADRDGHIRPPEIVASSRWLGEVLKNPDELLDGKDRVPIQSLRTDTEEGRRLKDAALHVLKSLGKEDAAVVTVEDATRTQEILTNAKANGDGVVPLDVLTDPASKQLAEDVLKCEGGVADRSGLMGVDGARLDQFLADCAAFDAWWRLGEADAKSLLPLGEATLAAAAAYEAVRAKVDDFFGRCRLAAFDPRAEAALNRQEAVYVELAAKALSLDAAEAAHLPLATVAPGRALPLTIGVNPSWAQALATLDQRVVRPLLGDARAELSETDWRALGEKLAAHRGWAAKKDGAAVEPLGIGRVREILQGEARVALAKTIAADLAVGATIADVVKVERLVRLYRDFRRLVSNFVSFSEFYARRGATFQVGTLYLDGRACDLCVRVDDAGKHAALAGKAGTYLAYVDCARTGSERMQVAAAFTAGDSDNLFVGRNGVFYDRKGRDWNATVTRIVDNPISIRQAFWSPYKKVMRWIEDQLAKRAAASEAASNEKLQGAAAGAGAAAATGKAPAQKPKLDIGVVAALGVAVGGITAALGALLDSFFGLGFWMPLGVVGAILLISGPSMVIAGLKLRQRNLGPLLDANGWAVNVMTRINMPLGAVLTAAASIPLGASRSLVDPYAEKKRLWPRLLVAVLLLALVGAALYKTGKLHEWWPELPLPSPPPPPAP